MLRISRDAMYRLAPLALAARACYKVIGGSLSYLQVPGESPGYFNMSRTLSRGNEGPSQENLSRLGPFYHHPMISSDRLCHQTDARIRSLIFAG